MGTSSSGQQQSPLSQLLAGFSGPAGGSYSAPAGGSFGGPSGGAYGLPTQSQSFQMPAPATAGYQQPTSQGGGGTGPAASSPAGSSGGPTPTNPLWTSTNIPGGLGGPNTGQTTGGLPASLQSLLGKSQPAASQPSKF